MPAMDEILDKVGLKYEDLTIAERDVLHLWSRSLQEKRITVNDIQDHISKMRSAVERELTKEESEPKDWFGVLSLFIPFYGIVKKWYLDQKTVSLKARLRNYMLLEAFLESPKRAREALDQLLAGLKNSKKEK